MAKTPTTTIRVDNELQDRIKAEGARIGLPWTKLLVVLAREALAQREARQ